MGEVFYWIRIITSEQMTNSSNSVAFDYFPKNRLYQNILHPKLILVSSAIFILFPITKSLTIFSWEIFFSVLYLNSMYFNFKLKIMKYIMNNIWWMCSPKCSEIFQQSRYNIYLYYSSRIIFEQVMNLFILKIIVCNPSKCMSILNKSNILTNETNAIKLSGFRMYTIKCPAHILRS